MQSHAGAVVPQLLLYGRVHVDLARNASACCPAA
ncbi:putative leader peptide [Streptomyces sp. NPDC002870]